jgi:hypothetical protein
MAEKRNECPYLAPCPLSETLALPTSVEILKVQFCRGEYTRCKRYLPKSSGKTVPKDVWPDGMIPTS